MRFDRKKFFDGFREKIDSTIEPEQVNGLEFLLDHIETDPFWKHIPQIAYALATVGHETAWSFQPVEEGYYLGDSARVRRFQKTLRYHPYFGRGYVQLTWKANYEKAGKILKLPQLVDKPDLAKDPNVAYKVLTRGMHQGWFTGKKLDDYIKGDKKDYKNARKIINGNDKDVLIAGYARKFEQILEDSAAVSSSEPTPKRAQQAETIPPAEQPPSDITQVETKTAETVETEVGKVETETTITQPKGDAPDVAPTKVTKSGPLSTWLFSGGGLAALGTMMFGFVQANLNAIAVGIICLTVLIIAIIFRKALTDAIRMQTAADPDKKNVT